MVDKKYIGLAVLGTLILAGISSIAVGSFILDGAKLYKEWSLVPFGRWQVDNQKFVTAFLNGGGSYEGLQKIYDNKMIENTEKYYKALKIGGSMIGIPLGLLVICGIVGYIIKKVPESLNVLSVCFANFGVNKCK